MIKLKDAKKLPVDYPETQRVAHRRALLKGTHNTRDIGGYQTIDGRSIRWGMLYRSDRLSKLRSRDKPTLQRMNLYSVIDFRSVYERERSPDRLPAEYNIKYIALPILDEGNAMIGKDIRDRIKNGNITGIDPHAMLIGANQEFVVDFREQYRAFLKILLEAEGQAVLWHCTSGKDRAGFAAALILTLLGVPEKTVFEDYLLTNRYLQPSLRRQLQIVRLVKGHKVRDLLHGFTIANEAFLRTAFDTVAREFGSFDAYIRDGLGITHDEVNLLKSRYLV